MLSFKQRFCKHRMKKIGTHITVSENLYQCDKCNVYMTHHYNIGLMFFSGKLDDKNEWRMGK